MQNDPYAIINKEIKIELIYLLDILFLLLILFIIYAMNAKPYHFIAMKLNQSSSFQTSSQKNNTLSLSKTKIFINKIQCNNSLIHCLNKQNIPSNETLTIRASKSTSLQQFINIFNILKNNNFKSLQLEVEKS
ncbi:MAG: hypothetical protein COB02_02310 [Candidatus Cloacimonadota bacterium]|nr:MAG: hypothetical protein COB02_02310 [Candidatus Cloacimonadota bacterium]